MPSPTEHDRAKAAAGDPEALRRVVEYVLEWERESGTPMEIAREVVREMYLAMKQGRYRPSRSIRKFALGIKAKLKFKAMQRTRQRDTAELDAGDRAEWESTADERAVDPMEWAIKSESREWRAKMKKAMTPFKELAASVMARLPARDAAILRILHVEPPDDAEIARELGIAPEAVSEDREGHLRRYAAAKLGMTLTELAKRYDRTFRRQLSDAAVERIFAADDGATGDARPLFDLARRLSGDEKFLLLKLLSGKSFKETARGLKNRLSVGECERLVIKALDRMKSWAKPGQLRMLRELERGLRS